MRRCSFEGRTGMLKCFTMVQHLRHQPVTLSIAAFGWCRGLTSPCSTTHLEMSRALPLQGSCAARLSAPRSIMGRKFVRVLPCKMPMARITIPALAYMSSISQLKSDSHQPSRTDLRCRIWLFKQSAVSCLYGNQGLEDKAVLTVRSMHALCQKG